LEHDFSNIILELASQSSAMAAPPGGDITAGTQSPNPSPLFNPHWKQATTNPASAPKHQATLISHSSPSAPIANPSLAVPRPRGVPPTTPHSPKPVLGYTPTTASSSRSPTLSGLHNDSDTTNRKVGKKPRRKQLFDTIADESLERAKAEMAAMTADRIPHSNEENTSSSSTDKSTSVVKPQSSDPSTRNLAKTRGGKNTQYLADSIFADSDSQVDSPAAKSANKAKDEQKGLNEGQLKSSKTFDFFVPKPGRLNESTSGHLSSLVLGNFNHHHPHQSSTLLQLRQKLVVSSFGLLSLLLNLFRHLLRH
jgi:hypothetical protein